MFSISAPVIERIIFADVDYVMAKTYNRLLKKQFGKFDVVHSLREEHDRNYELTDAEILKLSTRNVITSCWTPDRVADAVREIGWKHCRIYVLGARIY